MRETHSYDLIVVGGGINGAGVARDAAGRGLSVLLCEAEDLASHTSSASTKLIHGGLRYLEHYEFKLVGKALAEREVLLAAAPHIIWPLRFVLPHQKHLRPAWIIRAGLFLYDRLGGRQSLARSRGIRFAEHVAGAPLKPEFDRGFVYSDAWVQDARLVVLNCMDAASRGATILTRTTCESALRTSDGWQARLKKADGETIDVRARGLVNAAGPWAVKFLDDAVQLDHGHALRLVKGSHIVVDRLFEHEHAYIFQQPDGRIVFAIPYERNYTLIGTTDVEHQGAPGRVTISDEEIAYLCDATNRYFEAPIAPADVVWHYAGVRPLLGEAGDNASEVTRDYRIELDDNGAPLLNIFGGKLTTFRRLAEDAVNQLAPALDNRQPAWTGTGHPLPGGEEAKPNRLVDALAESHPFLPAVMRHRLVFAYGTRARLLLGDAQSLIDLGEHFGADLYAAEIAYLREHEWAQTAEDVLWRRSKLGLRLSAEQQARVAAYLDEATDEAAQSDTPAGPMAVARSA